MSATAIEGADVQTISYPCASGGDFAAAGYEFVESMQLIDHAQDITREAIELLSTPVCSTYNTNLILESHMLALLIHESCGHPVEFNRVMGMESSYAEKVEKEASNITPIKNLRITQSITEALSNVEMIGKSQKMEEGVLAPALKIKKFRFSSATEF